MELTAILIAPKGVAGPLGDLMERLGSVGVQVSIVDEVATAVEISRRHARPPAVLLDLREVGAGEVEDQQIAAETIRKTLAKLPSALPIVVTSEADPMLIVSCIRAGAGDVIDLQLEGTAAARAVVHRICDRQAERQAELAMMGSQRDMIEDLLKDLIRTERRSIDLEEKLGSVGKPIPGVSLKIVDADGKELPAGMVGTICLKTGPATPFVEYWEDPGLTSRHLQDGWFLTPARGRLDDEGVLWIGE